MGGPCATDEILAVNWKTLWGLHAPRTSTAVLECFQPHAVGGLGFLHHRPRQHVSLGLP